jgi:hypothetical protein
VANNNTNTSVTEIILQKGETQTFTMGLGKTKAKFVFTPRKKNEISMVKLI